MRAGFGTMAAGVGLAAVIASAGAQPLPPIAAPPAQGSPGAPPGFGEPPPPPPAAAGSRGRYQLSLVQGGRLGPADFVPHALLLDTATGQTWLLPPLQLGAQQTMVWTPVPFLSAGTGAASATPAPR